MNQRAQIQLLAANGSEMTVLGQTPLYLQHKDKTTVTFAIVARGVSHQALISWHDLKYLGVISSNFPEAKCSAVTAVQVREQTLATYPTVFRDAITETPMVGSPVHIHLKPNAVPFRISVARQIPLRFQAPAEQSIKQLLDARIVTPCDTPTEWCSPGFFVVKGDGKSVRLVTDYTKLNSFVERPVHPFPSVIDILQAIPASARVFAKFDAVNGYFQIPLDEPSSRLTTFLLPSSRYRYLRIPQGLNASSDEWCRRSDAVVEGLLWARKIVDDILIWADDQPHFFYVPPVSAIKTLLSRLHAGHAGQEKTLSLATKLFYWPGMSNDVKTFVQACRSCFKRLPSQRQNPSVTSPPSASFGPPMAQVGLDSLTSRGRNIYSV